MKNSRQTLGRWGEELAADYLRHAGYDILACNARTPYGEIDLIARPAGQATVVFVEVKTRTSEAFGLPEQAVDEKKQAHLLDSARYFLQQHPDLDGDWRVDVIAIQGRPNQPGVQIEWFENAVS